MADEETEPRFRYFEFHVDGETFTHLDLTGAEVRRLEHRFGVDFGDLRPMGNITHRLAILEAFLARTKGDDAGAQVEAMSLRDLDKAVKAVWGKEDDLPDSYVDGLPKAEDAP